jgi:NADH:ubiquinone oxidoreductase subunit F (NADH-binding)
MAELGAAFCSGHARPGDGGLLAELAADVRDAALCGLEADASNPLLSGMRYFASEFEAHIARGECPAGVCQPIRVAGAVQS